MSWSIEPTLRPAGSPGLRLDTLVRLRWLAIAGQSAGVLFVEHGLGFPTPLVATGLVILVATSLNVALSLRFSRGHRFSARSSALILAFDVLQLTALLALTGGLENPFSLLFLAPVMISAATLPPRLTMALGALTVLCVSIVAVWRLPLPWVPGQTLILPGVYIAGVWISILLGLGFTGVYAWRVAEEARQLADALAATELVLAREQQLHAVDGLAAAAAHQLGTPLATIAVVARELERQAGAGHPFRDDIVLLREQAGRCREILSKIASLAGEDVGPFGELSIGQLLEELAAPHRNFGVEIAVQVRQDEAVPVSARNPGVFYGLGNVIENAVDFAEAKVSITASWTADQVSVTVADDGPGFAPDILARLGEPYVSTRRGGASDRRGDGGGLGLGLFIARTLLERSGARVIWGNRLGASGACVDILWPRHIFEARNKPGSTRLGDKPAGFGIMRRV